MKSPYLPLPLQLFANFVPPYECEAYLEKHPAFSGILVENPPVYEERMPEINRPIGILKVEPKQTSRSQFGNVIQIAP